MKVLALFLTVLILGCSKDSIPLSPTENAEFGYTKDYFKLKLMFRKYCYPDTFDSYYFISISDHHRDDKIFMGRNRSNDYQDMTVRLYLRPDGFGALYYSIYLSENYNDSFDRIDLENPIDLKWREDNSDPKKIGIIVEVADNPEISFKIVAPKTLRDPHFLTAKNLQLLLDPQDTQGIKQTEWVREFEFSTGHTESGLKMPFEPLDDCALEEKLGNLNTLPFFN